MKSLQRTVNVASIMSVIMALLLASITIFLSGCGASNASMVRPVMEATRVACGQLQEHALEAATSHSQATEGVVSIRHRCDVAYTGIEAAGLLLEEVHGE